MKVEIKNKKEEAKDIEFPILMEAINSGGAVVLFIKECEGIVIIKGYNVHVGYYSERWIKCTNTNVWKPFTGIIELSNE